MPVKIYHNPRCSKSRQTLELLLNRGLQPEVVEYLKTPPSAAELDEILKALGLEPQDIVRSKEPEFKELGLDHKTPTRQEYLEILSRHPVLIERPIVVQGNKAALGRPPEKVLELF